MISRTTKGKAVFVFLCVILSALLVYFISARSQGNYTASLEFGIAYANENGKPDLVKEKNLLLSNEILVQVMRELNLLPASTSRFRSFDLGNANTAPADHQTRDKIAVFKKDLTVNVKSATSSIEILYTGIESSKVKKTLEVLFEKYRDWRRDTASSDFDTQSISADKEISEKREIFLQSQKQILDLMEAQKNPADPLQAKKTELDAKISALKLRYGPKHPSLIEALKQRDALEAQKAGVSENAQLLQLKKKLELDFKNLDEAMRKSVALEQQKMSSPAAIEILPMGDVVVRDLSDKIPYKVTGAALAAFLLSLLYLKIRSRYQPYFETADDIKPATGFECIASIPGLANVITGEAPMPSGDTAEKLKILRHELKLRADTTPSKLLTVTSSINEEGAAALVMGLGRLAARSGENVLILEADLRAPTLQLALPQNSIRNLVDYLSGQARIEDVIYKTDVSGVHVIYSTAVPNTALDLVSSEKMKTLLHSLREVYDLTLALAPPSSAGPDARILSTISDQVLYCVKAGQTGRKQVLAGLFGYSASNTSLVLIQN
ncbi:MAG: hypothetical protein DI586_04150 [Micavibrio aeruginosavorus]|uniref:Polysaccharide chain length determinant N-terminal domain-containing protein n=1 Tax=Micavibrio aeruginosavorus TaxID=349221 RepID=A0A2W5FK46_9BACT|nr:MAG: hypothetical protein DI586_04150 [Micavibrio aeruginosavorus]